MKIARIEPLHADGIWRNFDFLKITTDTGVSGIGETYPRNAAEAEMIQWSRAIHVERTRYLPGGASGAGTRVANGGASPSGVGSLVSSALAVVLALAVLLGEARKAGALMEACVAEPA